MENLSDQKLESWIVFDFDSLFALVDGKTAMHPIYSSGR